MNAFASLSLEQDFLSLPEHFYRRVDPQAICDPKLVIGSDSCSTLLGLDVQSLNHSDALSILSGQQQHAGGQALAMKYTGHQFGYYNPDLGDGRGLLLGNITSATNNKRYDLHLKGAGKTPFSRQGDGRAVLRSSIREYLASEAMAALGVPSSRALCVVSSDTQVYREQVEKAATLLRVSPTHIRFGHFEFAYHHGDTSLLKQLCHYTIARHYPCLYGSSQQYADFFILTAKKTAALIAQWQSIGFAHGVMNTDNMSILGETFDYGPYGFLDAFDPEHICNHSDHAGRYAFNKQPAIAHWNLSVLAQALSPLVDKDALTEGLQAYSQHFDAEFIALMRAKFGLYEPRDGDSTLIFDLLSMLADNRLDYSHFFRHLADMNDHQQQSTYADLCVDRERFRQCLNDLTTRWKEEALPTEQRVSKMQATNPKYVLRNHLAQEAIALAEKGDYSELRRLAKVLEKPFAEQSDFEAYADLPPDWAKQLEISCSS